LCPLRGTPPGPEPGTTLTQKVETWARERTTGNPDIKLRNSKKPLKKICVGKTVRNSTTTGRIQTRNRIRKTGQNPNGSGLLPENKESA